MLKSWGHCWQRQLLLRWDDVVEVRMNLHDLLRPPVREMGQLVPRSLCPAIVLCRHQVVWRHSSPRIPIANEALPCAVGLVPLHVGRVRPRPVLELYRLRARVLVLHEKGRRHDGRTLALR